MAVIAALGLVSGRPVAVGVSAAERSLEFRLEYWRATFAMIRDFPGWAADQANFRISTPPTNCPRPRKSSRTHTIGFSTSLGDGGDTSCGFLGRNDHSHHRANLPGVLHGAVGHGTDNWQLLPNDNVTATSSGPNAAVFGGVAGAAWGRRSRGSAAFHGVDALGSGCRRDCRQLLGLVQLDSGWEYAMLASPRSGR